jgi:hypothetical protein
MKSSKDQTPSSREIPNFKQIDCAKAAEGCLTPGRWRWILSGLKKYCSHSVKRDERAVFLVFGFVSAPSQGLANLLLRRSLAKTQNPRAELATVFFKPL